jgi:hypothetical protein
MTSLAIVCEQSLHCYSIGESKAQVDRPLRRAMLQFSGFAAILASSKGLLDPPYFGEATSFWKPGSNIGEPEQRRSEP